MHVSVNTQLCFRAYQIYEASELMFSYSIHGLPWQFLWSFSLFTIISADLVAIPDFSTGAEENWGLIGFTSSMLLFDPKKTSDELRQSICETVTHELAHQVGKEKIIFLGCK